MKITPGRAAVFLIALTVTIGAAALVAPHFDAGRFRAPLQAALERTLARKVELGDVRYRILPSPGLSALNVVIHELPEFGLEPLAYVSQLEAGLRWSSLFTGQLEISSVRLVEPSVNLARRDGGGWNFTAFLDQLFARGRPPSVVLSSGRINFRTGDLKSPYYLNEVDLELTASARGGEGFEWIYEGSPARTDRAGQGFGRFRGRGEWNPVPSPGTLNLDFILERSSTAEVVTLLAGRDLGITGRVSSRARLAGPLDAIKIEGVFNFEEFERTGFFGLRSSSLAAAYTGVLDIPRQRLDLDTAPRQKDAIPLGLRFRASSILSQPRWAALVRVNDIPAETLVDLGARLGAHLPAGLSLAGNVNGAVGFSSSEPTGGELNLTAVSASFDGGAPLKIPSALLSIEGDSLRLAPVPAEASPGSELEIGGLWNPSGGNLDFTLAARRLEIKDLASALVRLPGAPVPPLLAEARSGAITGNLVFQGGAGWSGNFDLVAARFDIPGAADPLRVRRAAVALKGEGYEIRRAEVDWGAIRCTGEFDRRADPALPVRFRLRAPQADAAEIERLFAPLLARRTGFLARTLRLRNEALPAWLRVRRAEGDIAIAELTIAGRDLAAFYSPVFWNGGAIDLPDLQARWDDSPVGGRLSIRLAADAPTYQFQGHIDNALWKSARWDSELDARLTGSALHVEANLTTRNLTLGDEIFRTATACVDYTSSKLRLKCFDATTPDGETFYGQSSLAPDGRFFLDLESPRRKLRLPFE